MLKSDFNYSLPEVLIAQTPIEPRDCSRLLVYKRDEKTISHKVFTDLIDYIDEGDLLVLNNSRVIPARLYGFKENTSTKIEFLLLEQKDKNIWEILVKPGKKLKIGDNVIFGEGILIAEILEIKTDGNRVVKFSFSGSFFDILEKLGEMPLPHYITEKLEDKERYQTVYSKELGSCAAPTAGLHFTPALMERIKQKGVNIAYVTLHVGIGTFRPVKANNITEHLMHFEHYLLPEETANLINETKAKGKRVICVGTTSCRTLEAVATSHNEIKACDGSTNIFIYPGYEFKVIDGLLTNFHLPESTLIMLVSAFAGYNETMDIYNKAVLERYRFFSFGDAMLLV